MRSKSEELVRHDEEESEKQYGQRLRKTFPLADFFIKAGSPAEIRTELNRFIELLFGNVWHTPSIDEQGMSMAYLARVRSSSPARQVGAAIVDHSGNVLAIGTNEVAKAGGGQYWQGDKGDGRDHFYDPMDMSDRMRRNLFGDLFNRMKQLGYLSEGCPKIDELLNAQKDTATQDKLRNALLFQTIDFVRAVHAEAAAILALHGVRPDPTTKLFVTTFPCHECARHIVMAGLRNVVYIEPYPKSLVSELYKDSISVDDDCESPLVHFTPFVGIAPTLYTTLFSLGEKTRKDGQGRIKKWTGPNSFPQILESYSEQASRAAEKEMLDSFNAQLTEKGFIDAPN